MSLSNLKIGGLYRFIPCSSVFLAKDHKWKPFKPPIILEMRKMFFVVLLEEYKTSDFSVDVKMLYNDKICWSYITDGDIFDLVIKE